MILLCALISTFCVLGSNAADTCVEGTCPNCYDTVCDVGENPLNFLLLGDWGGMSLIPYYTHNQGEVSEKMDSLSQEYQISFIASLGDNFYFTGVDDDTDSRFDETFEEKYNQDDLKDIPWYLIGGNHDHYGNINAQIEYTKKSYRWKFPRLYYTTQHKFSGGKTATFIWIDTVVLCGNTEFSDGVKNFIFGTEDPVPGPVDDQEATDLHWTWIEEQLQSNAESDYLIVLGHFPIYSVSKHGPTQCLVDRLEPLLRTFKVSAYIAGHDHNLQHIEVTNDDHTIHHLISGGGAYMDTSQDHKRDCPEDSLQFFYPTGFWAKVRGKLGWDNGGVMLVKMTDENAIVEFYDGELEQYVYEFAMEPRTT